MSREQPRAAFSSAGWTHSARTPRLLRAPLCRSRLRFSAAESVMSPPVQDLTVTARAASALAGSDAETPTAAAVASIVAATTTVVAYLKVIGAPLRLF